MCHYIGVKHPKTVTYDCAGPFRRLSASSPVGSPIAAYNGDYHTLFLAVSARSRTNNKHMGGQFICL